MKTTIHATAIASALLLTVLLGGCTVEYSFGGVLEPVVDPCTGEEIGLYDAYEDVYYLDDGSVLAAGDVEWDERCFLDADGLGDETECGCDGDPEAEIEVGPDLLCRGGECVTPIVRKVDMPNFCFLCYSCDEGDQDCFDLWCPLCDAEPL